MSYKTVEVELENGRVRPCGSETLPANTRALLTFVDATIPQPARTCEELAERWSKLDKLPPDESNAFADDVENARANLPPLKSAWD